MLKKQRHEPLVSSTLLLEDWERKLNMVATEHWRLVLVRALGKLLRSSAVANTPSDSATHEGWALQFAQQLCVAVSDEAAMMEKSKVPTSLLSEASHQAERKTDAAAGGGSGAGGSGPAASVSSSAAVHQRQEALAVATRHPRAYPERCMGAVRELQGHTGSVWALPLSLDGRALFSASDDSMIKQWDVAGDYSCVRTLAGHTDEVNALALSSDGNTLYSGARDRTIKQWDVGGDGSCARTLVGHNKSVMALVLSADGNTLYSGSDDHSIKQWDVGGDGSCTRTLQGHTDSVWALALSTDGSILYSGSEDKTIKLWDVAGDGSCTRTLEGHTDCLRALVVSPDGTLFSGSGDQTIRQWDVSECVGGGGGGWLRTRVLQGQQGHSGAVQALAVSADGRMLFSGSSDGTIKQWDVAGHGSCLRTLQADAVESLALSPSGRDLFSGVYGNGHIQHWLFLHAHIVAEATGSTLFPAIADLILQYAEDG